MNLIVHLSDLHISKQTKGIEDEIKRISDVLESFCRNKDDIKQIIIVVSGDLTYSGDVDEFKMFDEFVKELRAIIKTRIGISPYVLTCPGNHDIQFPKKLTRDELVAMSPKEKYDFYIPALDNYFNSSFANKWSSGFICKKTRKLI